MSNVTAYIGKDYGTGQWTSDEVMRAAWEELAARGIDSATFAEARGVWRGEWEDSVSVALLGVDAEAAREALQATCERLLQWSIVYTVDGAGLYQVECNAEELRKLA